MTLRGSPQEFAASSPYVNQRNGKEGRKNRRARGFALRYKNRSEDRPLQTQENGSDGSLAALFRTLGREKTDGQIARSAQA